MWVLKLLITSAPSGNLQPGPVGVTTLTLHHANLVQKHSRTKSGKCSCLQGFLGQHKETKKPIWQVLKLSVVLLSCFPPGWKSRPIHKDGKVYVIFQMGSLLNSSLISFAFPK